MPIVNDDSFVNAKFGAVAKFDEIVRSLNNADSRFDHMTRVLGSQKTRRLTLGALLGGALTALGLTDPDEAWAARSRKCKQTPGECQTCKKGKCQRKNGKKTCKKGKIKPKANGTLCSVGSCLNGLCAAQGGGGSVPPAGPGCSEGLTNCSGVCTNLQTDVANCGTCGTTCPTSTTCSGSRCCRPATSLCQVDAQCCSNNCAGIGGMNPSFCA